ncbi:hypothetical protein FQR65_LT06973 [Abscondita terminalis]|nr:hypothetical protein FQR65_LT06973 [Abscondita terminalis]
MYVLNMFEKRFKSFYPLFAITTTFTMIVIGMLVFSVLIVILLTTKLWPIAAIYLIWIFIIDRDTCESGGRPSEYVRNCNWFRNVFNYLPVTTKKQNNFDLDPKKNYLFCVFPHGIIPAGLSGVMVSDVIGCKQFFPKHKTYLLMLRANFFVPVLREMLLSVGCCSNSKNSMNWILGNCNGGNIVGISIGGGKEALSCIPGEHKVELKNRKGFIKVAILNGSPLVPVYSFGETDLFETIQFHETSVLKKFNHGCWKKPVLLF